MSSKNYTTFQWWILDVLNNIPELKIQIPDFVNEYLGGFIEILNVFIDVSLFAPLLYAYVIVGFIKLSGSIVSYVKSFRGVK